jgi:regulatory protein
MLTVTRLEPQKKNPQRLNVYLDGEFAFGISRAAAPWLEEGHQLSQQKIDDLQQKDLFESAYQRALNYLSYRPRSEKEIRQNLLKHKIPDETISAVLDRLRTSSLVDDRDFAAQWVENRIRFKPRGKRALSSELFQKGISNEIIDQTLTGIDEESLAFELARSKSRKFMELEEAAYKKKIIGLLARRGFPYPITRHVVDTLWLEIEKESKNQSNYPDRRLDQKEGATK